MRGKLFHRKNIDAEIRDESKFDVLIKLRKDKNKRESWGFTRKSFNCLIPFIMRIRLKHSPFPRMIPDGGGSEAEIQFVCLAYSPLMREGSGFLRRMLYQGKIFLVRTAAE